MCVTITTTFSIVVTLNIKSQQQHTTSPFVVFWERWKYENEYLKAWERDRGAHRDLEIFNWKLWPLIMALCSASASCSSWRSRHKDLCAGGARISYNLRDTELTCTRRLKCTIQRRGGHTGYIGDLVSLTHDEIR